MHNVLCASPRAIRTRALQRHACPVITSPLRNRFTPLDYAAVHGHLDVVKELLLYGATINQGVIQQMADRHPEVSRLLRVVTRMHRYSIELSRTLLDMDWGSSLNDI